MLIFYHHSHSHSRQVLSVVLTQDAAFVQRFLHPQLLPLRSEGGLILRNGGSEATGSDIGVSRGGSVSTLVVESRLVSPSRSGLAWSMMADGSPAFLLDAGDEIVLYK